MKAKRYLLMSPEIKVLSLQDDVSIASKLRIKECVVTEVIMTMIISVISTWYFDKSFGNNIQEPWI